jgi:WD40 repeat protein
VACVAFSPDRKQVASGAKSGISFVQTLDLQSGQSIGTHMKGQIQVAAGCVAFSSDGKQIVSSGDGENGENGKWMIHIWNSQTGEPDTEPLVHYHTGQAGSCVFSPDANHLLFVSLDNSNPIQVLDLKNHIPVEWHVEGNPKDIISIAISPQESRVAAASLSGVVWLWHWDKAAKSLQLLSQPMESPITGFTLLKFSQDSTELILTCINGTTCCWDAANGTPINTQSQSSDTSSDDDLELAGPMFFNVRQGWSCDELEETDLQWLPPDNGDLSVAWAYINGKVIRRNGETSVTIVDLNTAVQK